MGITQTVGNNTAIYRLLDNTLHGNFYDTAVYSPSFIDVCFAQPYKLEKRYISFNWDTTTKSVTDKEINELTFNSAIVYNYHRHSNAVTLTVQTFNAGNVRDTGGQWNFNDFNDMLSDKTVRVLDDLDIRELQLTTIPALDLVTNWYDKGMFIDNYIVVRLQYDNLLGDGIIINDVGAISNQTGRI